MEKWIPLLPHLNATLNFLAACTVSLAWLRIRRGDREGHKRLMIVSLVISLFFLVSYLTYHEAVGNVKFAGQGTIRTVYFTILASHVILAAAITFLVPATVWRAWTGRFDSHRRVARWTLPLWLYVSVTGVVVYLLAFHVYPSA